MPPHRRFGACLSSLLGALSCAPPVGPGGVHAPAEPLPEIRLELALQGQTVGLRGADAGPMCNGEVSGVVSIRGPAGAVSRLAVSAARVSETVCLGCDPVPGHPHSCDAACHPAFRSFIELGQHAFELAGEYVLTGDPLALSCAPGRTRIRALYVSVDGQGHLSASTERAALRSAALVSAAVPAPPAREDAQLGDCRERFARLSGPLIGHAEGLLIQVEPQPALPGRSRTRWGNLRSFHAGTPSRFITEDRGPFSVFVRTDAGAAPVPLAAPGEARIITVAVEQASADTTQLAQSGGAVLSAWQLLDGEAGAAQPRGVGIDVSATLDDAAQRWAAFLEAMSGEVAAALATAERNVGGRAYGRERTSIEDSFAPTWLPASQTLSICYTRRVTRSSERHVRENSCPRNRPGECHSVLVPDTRAYHADVGDELEYDHRGELVRERPLAPRPAALR